MPNPIAAVAAVVSTVANKNAASSAKRAAAAATGVQAESLQDAKDITDQQYGVSKGYLQPYADQGAQGQNALMYGLGLGGTDPGANSNVTSGSLTKPFSMTDYQEDPGYQFRLSEGMKALDRGASAKRGYLSGAAQKGLQRFAQDQASGEYQNAFNRYNTNQTNTYNRLNSLADTGLTTANNLSTLSSNYGQNIANLDIGQGANAANGLMAKNAANQQMYQGFGQIGGQAAQAFGGGSNYNLFGSGTNYNPANIQYGTAANNLPWQV